MAGGSITGLDSPAGSVSLLELAVEPERLGKPGLAVDPLSPSAPACVEFQPSLGGW